jgi:hypothetical protein
VLQNNFLSSTKKTITVAALYPSFLLCSNPLNKLLRITKEIGCCSRDAQYSEADWRGKVARHHGTRAINFIEMHRMRLKKIINILQAVESKLLGTLRSTTVLLVYQAVLIESQEFKTSKTVLDKMP